MYGVKMNEGGVVSVVNQGEHHIPLPFRARAETNLRCAAAESAAAGEYRKKKNRADRIRTCDLFVPNEARYQPALQLAV